MGKCEKGEPPLVSRLPEQSFLHDQVLDRLVLADEGNDWRIVVKMAETIPNPEANQTASSHDAIQFLFGQFNAGIDVLVHRSVPFVKRFAIYTPYTNETAKGYKNLDRDKAPLH